MSTEPPSDPFIALARRAFRQADEYENSVILAARNGDHVKLRDLMLPIRRRKSFDDPHVTVLTEVIANPEAIPKKTELLRAVFDTNFDNDLVFAFIGNPQEMDLRPSIWTMYARDTNEDTLKASAILLAESIWNEIRSGEKISGFPTGLLNDKTGLAASFSSELLKSSLLATQHALVDHVAASNANDLTRGGGFLKFSDFLEGAELWTRKIAEIKEHKTYSIKQGDVVTFRPTFD